MKRFLVAAFAALALSAPAFAQQALDVRGTQDPNFQFLADTRWMPFIQLANVTTLATYRATAMMDCELKEGWLMFDNANGNSPTVRVNVSISPKAGATIRFVDQFITLNTAQAGGDGVNLQFKSGNQIREGDAILIGVPTNAAAQTGTAKVGIRCAN